MRAFMTGKNCDNKITDQISDIIMATRIPSRPVHLLEAILCDADTWHLGTTEFFRTDEQVRQEMLYREEKSISDWNSHTLQFMITHQFFTTYCKQKLNEGKLTNIAILRSRTGNK